TENETPQTDDIHEEEQESIGNESGQENGTNEGNNADLPVFPDLLLEQKLEKAVYYEVSFFDWEGNRIGSVQSVAAGESAVAPQAPEREGYIFTGWSTDYTHVQEDLEVYAQYKAMKTYTIKIVYVGSANQEVAEPYIATVTEGYQLKMAIYSPSIEGYVPDQFVVRLDIEAASEDLYLQVTYSPADTTYQVQHFVQDLDLTHYTLREQETLSGISEQTVMAVPKTYEGFTVQTESVSASVASDGSTILQVKYTRNVHNVYFDTDQGSYISPYNALYGQNLTIPEPPTRPGYAFGGWEPELPQIMADHDIHLKALWNTVNTSYTVVYWLENIAESGHYDYVGSQQMGGQSGDVPAVPSDESGILFPIQSDYYFRNEAKTEQAVSGLKIKGNGSTIVNIYYDRKTYTITFDDGGAGMEVDGSFYRYNDGNPYIIEAKYGAAIDHLWPVTPPQSPQDPETNKFRGWRNLQVSTSIMYHSTKQYFMKNELVHEGGTTLRAEFIAGTYPVTIHYLFQEIGGSGYIENNEYMQTVNWAGSGIWYPKAFAGFTADPQQESGIPFSQDTGDIFFKYDRNQYKITFYNGESIVSSVDQISYGKGIAPYFIEPSTRPSGMPPVYEFVGWYTTEECYEGTGFTFENA
ncbi:InlB B-repeat-containing protein, partial [Lacrimispora sp.]|uniref:InlB B-repeat-containing protein n=1 Tax=Lacrimispora sp. TaxID=2719234 RepID=UPI0028AE52C9